MIATPVEILLHPGLHGLGINNSVGTPYLGLVNLKNAIWRRTTGPEAANVEWRSYWTSGRQGLASWPAVANELRARGYEGDVCLTAEYSDQDAVDRLIAEDIAFAKSLFA